MTTTNELLRVAPSPVDEARGVATVAPLAPADGDVAAVPTVDVSVVIPVYNEEAGLAQLFARLYPALDAMAASRGLRYEVVFVNDGSRDRSAALLADQFRARPDVTRVMLFNANYGQHMAIMAGFERVRGRCIVTLDADLQNPPEEIVKLRRRDGGRPRLRRHDPHARDATPRGARRRRGR